MVIRKKATYLLSVLLLFISSLLTNAQEIIPVVTSIQEKQSVASQADTMVSLEIKDSNLNKIADIREQFEKQNATYSKPSVPSQSLLRFIQKDKLEISQEAKELINNISRTAVFNDYVSFNDTVIVNPLFLPLVFKGNILPENIEFTDTDILHKKTPYDSLIQQDSLFKEELRRVELEQSMYTYIRKNHPTYFKYSEQDFPKETITPLEIKKEIHEDMPIIVKKEVKTLDDMEAPAKFIPDRMYWQSNFESLIQFTQNHFSENWHKGGTSNLNLLTRHIINYNYSKDKIVLNNTMDLKIGVYNAPNDTLRKYKVSDNSFRLYSSLGYQAFNNKWHYTITGEFNTQMFKNYAENTKNLQVGFLAPYTTTLGVGMTYSFNKQYEKYKKLAFILSIDPISLTYRKTIDKDINMGAQGFQKIPDTDEYKTHYTNFGSEIRIENITFQINRNILWTSRIKYTTNYERVIGEFENTMSFILSRFFSTNLYLYSRYDDGVTKTENSNSYFQLNESLMIGFNYKW